MSLRPHEVELELFTHRFTAIASLMGEMLQRTALSTNVRERLDFSCGLLDAEGRLLVNAPHIPVHLGALGLCVRSVLRSVSLEPGDAVVTNHPGHGGSHLPDVTVITPVFHGERRLGFVASRAHHSEIGGMRPGSMPPDASCLAEEGVVIPPTHLVRGGSDVRGEVRALLLGGRYPSRTVPENMADLDAALAANRRGAAALEELAERFGLETVTRYMDALRDTAAERLEAVLRTLPSGSVGALERLDDGTPIQVAIEIGGGRLRADFTGTGGVHPG
ncbi:MAG: hydantoinase B/oxoprolinase family protein, partial [Acidobacteriota bacterium]